MHILAVQLYATVFVLGGLAGLADLLDSRRQLSARSVFTAVLYSGLVSVAAIGIWYGDFSENENPWAPLGISVVAGYCRGSVLDRLKTSLRREGES